MELRKLLAREFDSDQALNDYREKIMQQAIREQEIFYFPAEVDDEKEGKDKYTVIMDQVQLQNGMVVLPVFTGEDSLKAGKDLEAYPIEIDELLSLFMTTQEYDGILINCFDKYAPVITKAMAQRILEPFIAEKLHPEAARSKINHAIRFAVEMHSGQKRKGTEKPYIIHPLEVMNLLEQMDADPNLMIAGALHDVVEDAGVSVKIIADRFGLDVAALVASHSEKKSWSWEDRKKFCIAETAHGSRRMKMLVLADTLSNQGAMLRDYNAMGDELWKRFNCSKKDQAWYYSGKQDALWDLQFDAGARKAYWQMVNDYKDLFVSYFLDVAGHKIYQQSYNECHVFDRDQQQWCVVGADEQVKGIEITRIFAETIEDAWNLKAPEKRQWKEWLFSDVEDPTSEEIAAMIIEQLKAAGVVKEAATEELSSDHTIAL